MISPLQRRFSSSRTPKLERRWLAGRAARLPCPANNLGTISRGFPAATDRQDACSTTAGKCPLRSSGFTLKHFNVATWWIAALCLAAAARAQLPLPGATTFSSVSGQFVVGGANTASPLFRPPMAASDTAFVRLEPALLAVSAERVKQAVWRQLGIDASAPWRGRILLALHPAATPDENVTIVFSRLVGVWNYRVELPDILSRARLTRALTGAVLLELANRDNPNARSAEIPAWLTEGLSQLLLAPGVADVILSPPDQAVNGLLQNRIVAVRHGVDPLAPARSVLNDHRALTFDELSWPDDAQLNGDDDGVYRASAQLFVNALLKLNHGAEHLRAMLQMLPDCYNWQTAFRAAFAEDFPQPVDLEKWWALQTVGFSANDDGPAWTPAVSRAKLDEVLSVPVEMRSAPTNLPVHEAISLQAVILQLDFGQQAAILETELRDLEQVQWRMAPQFAVLTAAYRSALADYLGGRKTAAPANRAAVKSSSGAPSKGMAAATVKKLDALDAQRLTLDIGGPPDVPAPMRP